MWQGAAHCLLANKYCRGIFTFSMSCLNMLVDFYSNALFCLSDTGSIHDFTLIMTFFQVYMSCENYNFHLFKGWKVWKFPSKGIFSLNSNCTTVRSWKYERWISDINIYASKYSATEVYFVYSVYLHISNFKSIDDNHDV